MRQVHIILQGKGGVGKSFVASLLIQYFRFKNQPVLAIDTDPVNNTLAGYKAFDAQRLTLLENGKIIERKFDELMETIANTDSHIVVDSGASTFVPLASYLKENSAIDMILDWEKQILIHTVITGGQALPDTIGGFSALAEQMPLEVKIGVWLNEYFGPIQYAGKTFDQSKVYQTHYDRIYGILLIPRYTESTFGQDIQAMLDKRLTFEQAIDSPEFGIMAKSRLKKVRKVIFDQLDQLFLVEA